MAADPVAPHACAEVRCPSGALNFKVIDGDRIEVKCNHRNCTGGGQFVVLHRYSIPECELLQTIKLTDPVRGRGARNSRKEVP